MLATKLRVRSDVRGFDTSMVRRCDCLKFSGFSLYENDNSNHFPFKNPPWRHPFYDKMAATGLCLIKLLVLPQVPLDKIILSELYWQFTIFFFCSFTDLPNVDRTLWKRFSQCTNFYPQILYFVPYQLTPRKTLWIMCPSVDFMASLMKKTTCSP